MVDNRGETTFSAYSFTSEIGSVRDVSDRKKIGKSAGLTFRKAGGSEMSGGSCRIEAEMADCTSRAAASMLRSSSNSRVTRVVPSALSDVIARTPAIFENWFSSGVATAAAIVSGLAPGRRAETSMVGKSTFGSSATGSER